MAQDFKELVATVKQAYSIEDYIASDGVSLKQSGLGKLKGLCPFHSEKTPSFTVDTSFQTFYCFGCHAKGDIIEYVIARDNLSFTEALQILGESKGIEVSFSGRDGNTERYDYPSLYATVNETAKFFVRQFRELPEDHAARKQITERGLEFSSYPYGYAPEDPKKLYNFLKGHGFTDEVIFQTGVCQKSEKGKVYPFWSGRLMFTITDIHGRPVGFSGRKCFSDDRMKGKYVNSSDTPLFHKSRVLFHANAAKVQAASEQTVFITEGQFDVVAMDAAGLTNTVAASGTAFTEEQARLCTRLAGGDDGQVVFCFDGDAAGEKAALSVFSNHPSLHSVAAVVSFPSGEDPCDYRAVNGDESLVRYVTENRTPIVEFVIRSLLKRFDLKDPTGKARFVAKVSSALALVQNAVIRESGIKFAALEGGVSIEAIQEGIKSAPKRKRESIPGGQSGTDTERFTNNENDSLTISEVTDLLEQSYLFAIESKLLALSAKLPNVASKIREQCTFANKATESVLTQMVDLQASGDRVIPERFTESVLVEHILDHDFLPLLTVFSEQDAVNLARYLLSEHKKECDRIAHEESSAEALKILSLNGSPSDLQRVLDREAESVGAV